MTLVRLLVIHEAQAYGVKDELCSKTCDHLAANPGTYCKLFKTHLWSRPGISQRAPECLEAERRIREPVAVPPSELDLYGK